MKFMRNNKLLHISASECLPQTVYLNKGIAIWRCMHRASTYNTYINLLKPTGQVMHQQFNIQQLYALPTLHLCVLYLSENKQRLVPLTA